MGALTKRRLIVGKALCAADLETGQEVPGEVQQVSKGSEGCGRGHLRRTVWCHGHERYVQVVGIQTVCQDALTHPDM